MGEFWMTRGLRYGAWRNPLGYHILFRQSDHIQSAEKLLGIMKQLIDCHMKYATPTENERSLVCSTGDEGGIKYTHTHRITGAQQFQCQKPKTLNLKLNPEIEKP